MSVTLDTIRVLHVDDEPDFTDVASIYLEREDDRFEVETATSASEGLDRLTDDVDCVVSDYDMPGRDGIEFLETVRDEFPDIPFVLYTGKGSEEVASEAITAGVTEYLQKESGTGQYAILANRIKNAVRQYRSQQELEASQQRLSLFIEQSSLGVLEYDENFEIVGLNPAGQEILGYSEEELRGETWEKIVTSSSYENVDRVTSALAEAEGGYHSIDENVRKDGERIICEWHNRVVTDDDGEVVAVFSQFQDVTEREERKERLERTTARLEALFEGSPDMLNIHDAGGNIVDPNSRLCEATGYSESELTDMKVGDLTDAIDPDTWREMDVGDRLRLDREFERRDGSTFPVEIHVRRLNLAGDDRFVMISRDTSNRVEREDQLQRSNRLLSTLFGTLPVGVLAEDESRNVLAVNEEMFELFEMPGAPEELVGADCKRMAEEASEAFVDAEGFLETTDDLVTSHEAVYDEEWRLKNGRTYARSHESISLPEGRGHLWVYRDVTDRKEHERRLETLNETTQELMAADSVEAVAELAVDAAAAMFDSDLAVDAVYLTDDESRLVPVATANGARADADELPVFTDRENLVWRVYEHEEVTRAGADESAFDESALGSELCLPINGHGVLIAGAAESGAFDQQDVIFGQILAGNVTTALEQVDRTEQLRARKRELTRQNERLEEFNSVISHDLRNPLNVATGRLELLAEECDSEHVASIERAHERMGSLIDDLLTLARDGRRVGEVETVDLGSLARNCWETVETDGGTLEVETGREVRADASRLQQLLENLVRNTVEHGGEDVTVTVGELDDGFYVEDDGPGIPEEERETVFDAGYSTSTDGTGFGLAIVEQVANAHDWTVRVTEGADGGARFEITGI